MQGYAEEASEGSPNSVCVCVGGESRETRGTIDPTVPDMSPRGTCSRGASTAWTDLRPERAARMRRAGRRGAARCMLGVVVRAVGRAERLTQDPFPPVFLSGAPLPGCVAQTFPACISHFGRPLFQARKLHASDSPTCR